MQDAPRCHQDVPKTAQDGPKMAPRGLSAAEPAREPESKSEHFDRVLEGSGPSCAVKTTCFIASVRKSLRERLRRPKDTKGAERGPSIICGNS